jgi:hypothetical protein
MSGFRVTLGARGRKLSSSPANTSTIGYGRLSLRATAANNTTNASNERKTSSTA